MASLLTRFVVGGEAGEDSAERSEKAFDSALQEIAKILRSELQRRGLYRAPPRFLGIVGRSFTDADTFTDLLYDAYTFAILERLPGLRRRARTADIDGAIRTNIRHFLFERQRLQDPVGYRVFEIVRDAAHALVDDGRLEVAAEPAARPGSDRGKLHATTLLLLPPFDDRRPSGPLADELAGRWCEELMPDLVTAYHRGDVVERLGRLVERLPDSDVSAFLLRDLVDPLKRLARRRAVALFTEGAIRLVGEDGPEVDYPVPPSGHFEQRQAYRRLLDCVHGHVERRPSTKERNYLRRLLDYLAAWSAMIEEEGADKRPSDAELSRTLDIPRGRLPSLLATLSEMTSKCRAVPGRRAGAVTGRSPPAADDTMSLDARREELRRATAAAADDPGDKASVATTGGWIPDLLTAGQVVTSTLAPQREWLVASWGEDGGRLVPVDDAPMRGSRDLDLSAGAGEPLVARCAHAIELSARGSAAATLAVAWRLPSATAGRALDALAAALAELDELDAPPALEIDASSVYREHAAAVAADRDALAAAEQSAPLRVVSRRQEATAAEIPRRTPTEPAIRRGLSSDRLTSLLAAVFALVAVGLVLHEAYLDFRRGETRERLAEAEARLAELQTRLDEALGPRLFDSQDSQTVILGTVRGGGVETLTPKGDRLLLQLAVLSIDPYPSYELRWIARGQGPRFVIPLAEPEGQSLDLPAEAGLFDLELWGLPAGGDAQRLHRRSFRVVLEE